MQAIVIATLTILYQKPSFAKDMLIQQYVALVSIGFYMAKSMFLIANAILYLTSILTSDNSSDTPQVNAQIFKGFTKGELILPDIIGRESVYIGSFLGVILFIVFTVMSLLEIASLILLVRVTALTKRIIQKVKHLRISSEEEEVINVLSINVESGVPESPGREEIAGIRMSVILGGVEIQNENDNVAEQ